MTDHVFVHYRLPDGRSVAFTHPDAVTDRKRAIALWMSKHPTTYRKIEPWSDKLRISVSFKHEPR